MLFKKKYDELDIRIVQLQTGLEVAESMINSIANHLKLKPYFDNNNGWSLKPIKKCKTCGKDLD